jgi:FkbM family methyltransferase
MRWKLEYLVRLLPLLFDIQAVRAMISWPKFSITAYGIVSDLFKQGVHPKTIIDVGANEGQFAVAALNIFRSVQVHAFEPLGECIERLRAYTSSYTDVHIHAVALGAQCEKTHFFVNNYNLASSTLKISAKHRSEFPFATEKETRVVEVSTLDRYFSNKILISPVLLKIDVQGAEKLVLDGGHETLKSVDYVMLETSFSEMYIGDTPFMEMIELMKALHFFFVRPISFLKSPINGEILQADVLFKREEIETEF